MDRRCDSDSGISQSKHSRRIVPMTRSQMELAIGLRGGDFNTVIPSRPIDSSRCLAKMLSRSCRQSNDLNAFSDENAAQCVRVFRIPIENQIALAAKQAVVRVGEIPRVRHPPAVGMGSDTRDLHGAVDDIDQEQNVVCHQCPDSADLDGEKICRHQAYREDSPENRTLDRQSLAETRSCERSASRPTQEIT